MLSTKVSIALHVKTKGTGSSSYQRKTNNSCSHTITQQKNHVTRTYQDIRGKKSGPAHYLAKVTSIFSIVYLFNNCKKCHSNMSSSGTSLWSLLFLPRWSLPHLHPIPYSTHAPQISARRSWSLFCFCPSFIC